MIKLTLLLTILFITTACFNKLDSASDLNNLNIKYDYLIARLDKKNVELDSLISEYNHGIDTGVFLTTDYLSEKKLNLIVRYSTEADIILDKVHEIFDEIKRVSEINN